MRLMEKIRQQGKWWLIGLVLFFVVSIFAGLGVGSFSFRGCAMQPGEESKPLIKSGIVDKVVPLEGLSIEISRRIPALLSRVR